ncbi:uncharacterized protein LOC114278686 isoform X3 [Camellia sinensis]|uniref:Uncharacterized protein n=1 Tax=Camellia sinensis var. sinensis TaxID=542762 RepID=A0A4S4EGC2_CAMSN|nr:uncharacterized protein LOC114278686 isoform X3 [Camellia sinensis]THG15062.1 hypothetical protein TEA_019362 [Camellia sinensis var. sinensis]
MVPGTKTGRRKKTTTDPWHHPQEHLHMSLSHHRLYPMRHNRRMTQTFVEEKQAHDVGKSTSTRVRGPTIGKGVQKRIVRKKGEKLHVYVNHMLNALTGGNAATLATNELGLLIRRLCPLKGVKSWKKIDQSIKDAVVQVVLDTFEIGEDFHTDQQAQEIVDTKAYLLYKDWWYTLKQHFEKLVKEGVDDPYSHPPIGVCLDDWKHMIDVAWKDDSHLKRSKAGKANRSLLPYNHTSGSRSFPIAMSLMDAMVNLQATATDAGIPLTQEELSRQVLGQRKNYLCGFRIGPRPYSPFDSAARSRDKQMEAMRSEMEFFTKI